MKSARFVPAARREFLAEIVYYKQEQAGLGARFTAAVEEAAARALAFPLAGSPAAANTRRVFLQGLPFSVVYREVEDGVEEAWRIEIERRAKEIESGAVQSIPWEVVQERLGRAASG